MGGTATKSFFRNHRKFRSPRQVALIDVQWWKIPSNEPKAGIYSPDMSDRTICPSRHVQLSNWVRCVMSMGKWLATVELYRLILQSPFGQLLRKHVAAFCAGFRAMRNRSSSTTEVPYVCIQERVGDNGRHFQDKLLFQWTVDDRQNSSQFPTLYT